MKIQNTKDFMRGINVYISSREIEVLKYGNIEVFCNEYDDDNYIKLIIGGREYWISFEEKRRVTKSFIHLYDYEREKPSMIQFTLDDSNFKISNDRFKLIQNRGTTIGRKVKGMKEQFQNRMYDLGFNKDNIIVEGKIKNPNFDNILTDIFNWVEIRLKTKLELESKYRNVENISNENESWIDTGEVEDINSKTEGGKKVIISIKAERDNSLRNKAIKYHGTTCMACGFNFKEFYGDWSDNYIEVHHLIPLNDYKERETDVKLDLAVLCANCHRMVHKKRNMVLTIEELKGKIKTKANN